MSEKFDFSFASYDRLLKLFQKSEYECVNYFDIPSSDSKILLRHDIDIDIFNCKRMSELELGNSFSSTWFFQPNNDYYNPLSSECMRILRDLSEHHTLGLHIDPVLFPDAEQLERGVVRLYDFYSGYFDVKKVISFHRPAKYLKDPAASISGFVNAYDHIFLDSMTYVSDSNRREFFGQERIWEAYNSRRSVILLTHPLWWREDSLDREALYKRICESAENNICRKALAGNITLYGYLEEQSKEV